jgi:hypothetical protein
VYNGRTFCAIVADRPRTRLEPADLGLYFLESLQCNLYKDYQKRKMVGTDYRMAFLENLVDGDERLECLDFVSENGLYFEAGPY